MEDVRIILLESEQELQEWSRHLYFNGIQWMFSFVQTPFKKIRKVIFKCSDELFNKIRASVKEEMYAYR